MPSIPNYKQLNFNVIKHFSTCFRRDPRLRWHVPNARSPASLRHDHGIQTTAGGRSVAWVAQLPVHSGQLLPTSQ